MSFILTLERPRVAFSPATGKQALFDETVVTCRLDIRSNVYIDMGGMGDRKSVV